jgi:UTP--glucose-1-phosphate uridylyltransferase
MTTQTEGHTMIKKCLFPAAGYGTRFLPATKAMPKEMLPIMTKPLIQYGVEEALESGCDVMAIITGRGKRAITDHFDISYELEHQIKGSSKEALLADIRNLIEKCTFTYTRQNEMKGLGDAIYKGKVLVGDSDPFAVILADDLCINPDGDGILTQMVKLYEKYKCCIVATMEVPMEEVHKYGVIEGNEIEPGVYMVSNMVEKPDNDKAPSNQAVIGRYILTPDIFEVIQNTKPGKNGELQITDALKTQAEKGMVIAYNFKGKRFDCGSVDGFVEATNYFYNLDKAKEEKAAKKK